MAEQPQTLPDLPSPILAAAFAGNRLWVGGLGGVAHEGSAGQPPQGPLSSVAALSYVDGTLIAGGAEGIARLANAPGGQAWELADAQSGGSPVVAITQAGAGSGDEHYLVAATLGDGVLRSTDGGKTWMTSNFGLDELEVTAVASGPDGTLLAGTTNGLYRSRDGRGWRSVAGADGMAIAGVLFTRAGPAVAATEEGAVLRSADGGATWEAAGSIQGTASCLVEASGGRLFAGTIDAGIWSSADGGEHWIRDTAAGEPVEVYCLAADSGRVVAGTAVGLEVRDDEGWREVPAPPTHDFTQSVLWHGRPLFVGTRSGLAHLGDDGTWTDLRPPVPLLCAAVTPKGQLLVSSLTGLFARDGDTWTRLVDGDDGRIGRMDFRADGTGLASSADHGRHLLRTRDGGLYWQAIQAPFGVLPPTELRMFEETVMVKTFDQRTNVLTVWGSRDDGSTWEVVWQGPSSPGGGPGT